MLIGEVRIAPWCGCVHALVHEICKFLISKVFDHLDLNLLQDLSTLLLTLRCCLYLKFNLVGIHVNFFDWLLSDLGCHHEPLLMRSFRSQ